MDHQTTIVPAFNPISRQASPNLPVAGEWDRPVDKFGIFRINPANTYIHQDHVPTHAAVARRERSFIFVGIISLLGFDSGEQRGIDTGWSRHAGEGALTIAKDQLQVAVCLHTKVKRISL